MRSYPYSSSLHVKYIVYVYVMRVDCQDETQEKDALIRWLGENFRAGEPLLLSWRTLRVPYRLSEVTLHYRDDSTPDRCHVSWRWCSVHATADRTGD